MKAKITVSVTFEYEMNPENYMDGERTPEQMLATDLANINDDPFSFIDSSSAQWVIAGELLKEET